MLSLVFAGGGAKGSFQIGVWKALKERNITDEIQAISGTSIGALNAVLFALGNYEEAEEIWCNINTSDIFAFNNNKEDGFFSRDGLKKILSKIDLSRLNKSKIDVFVTTYNRQKNKVEYHIINNMTIKEKTKVLLATSAIPIIYPSVNINGVNHKDGGIIQSGNVPIEPIYENGYRDILIVSLDYYFNIYNLSETLLFNNPQKRIDIKNRYPNCNFKIIKPLSDLGTFGIFDFTQTGIRNRMFDGYNTANKILTNKEITCVKNKYANLNFDIKSKMESLFKNQIELESFIKCANFGDPNLEMSTMGGTFWYENIVEIFGWKLQQHKLVGLKNHYRILDHNNVRRAWVLNPEDILIALENYGATLKFQRK